MRTKLFTVSEVVNNLFAGNVGGDRGAFLFFAGMGWNDNCFTVRRPIKLHFRFVEEVYLIRGYLFARGAKLFMAQRFNHVFQQLNTLIFLLKLLVFFRKRLLEKSILRVNCRGVFHASILPKQLE